MSNVDDIVKEYYYVNSNMIKFLIVENLALKSLLYEKGIIDINEYKKHQKQANDLVENKAKDQIEKWINENNQFCNVVKELGESNSIHSINDSAVS
jgi:hypothetical protein